MSEEKFDYSGAVEELEKIAAKMEDPGTAVDDISALVSRSKELLAKCREHLRSVRESVEEDG